MRFGCATPTIGATTCSTTGPIRPRQIASVPVRDEPGWITFTLDGRHALASTGEIIRVEDRTIAAALSDELGRPVHSEKMLQIDFRDGLPLRNADQFGVGRRAAAGT